jgi:hypothetical protein
MPDDIRYPEADLLIGGAAIAAFIQTLVDPACEVTPKMVFHWIEQEHLPVKRIGSRIIASKSVIRRRLFPA